MENVKPPPHVEGERRSKCIAPVTMTASVVRSVPITADGELADRADLPVEQRDVQHAHAMATRIVRPRQPRPHVSQVPREADVAGGDLERAAQDELPDEQEATRRPSVPAEPVPEYWYDPPEPGIARPTRSTRAVGHDDDERGTQRRGLRPPSAVISSGS